MKPPPADELTHSELPSSYFNSTSLGTDDGFGNRVGGGGVGGGVGVGAGEGVEVGGEIGVGVGVAAGTAQEQNIRTVTNIQANTKQVTLLI